MSNMTPHKSEVAHFREQQALRDQSAHRGLYGPAIVANHASNTVRMHQGAERILGLIHEGKHEEAEAIMNTEYWEGNDDAALTDKEAAPTR